MRHVITLALAFAATTAGIWYGKHTERERCAATHEAVMDDCLTMWRKLQTHATKELDPVPRECVIAADGKSVTCAMGNGETITVP